MPEAASVRHFRVFCEVVAAARREFGCEAVLSLDESLTLASIIAPCYTGPDREAVARPRCASVGG
jgi:hypothetical protein